VTPSEGFRLRLREAVKRREIVTGTDMTQGELARAVSEAIGVDPPLGQAAASRWLNGSVPGLDVIAGLAAVLGVRAGWLAFGELPAYDEDNPRAVDPMTGRLPDEIPLDEDAAAIARTRPRPRKVDRRRRPA
jgi:transcriptional regulator with XRE-family HTH domain